MLDLFTIVWGAMAQSYLDVTLPCLLQGRNIPAAKGLIHSYTFYASGEAKDVITSSDLYRRLQSLVPVHWEPLQKGEWEVTSNMLRQMERSARRGNYMHFLAPDAALGDESILNLAMLANGAFNPIFYGPVKISAAGFGAIKSFLDTNAGISNRELVSISMRHILGADYTLTEQGEQCWAVVHKVFSPCLLPDTTIIDFFSANSTPGSGFDHVLPYFVVRKGYPWYIIDHSDTYFSADGELGGAEMKRGQGTWEPEMVKQAEAFFSQFQGVWQGK